MARMVRRTWQIMSATSKSGKTYTVTEWTDGSWGCACPAWTRNAQRPDCKHILQVKLTLLQQGGEISSVRESTSCKSSIVMTGVSRKFNLEED